MLHPNLRAVADLEWLFGESEGDLKRDVRSLQSGFEAEMKARSRRARHPPLDVRRPDGSGGVLWRDNGMRCGLVYVGDGDENAPARGIDPRSLLLAQRERRVRSALRRADEIAYLGNGWTCQALPSDVLRLRYREFLPGCRESFGLAGEAGRRGRKMAACIGVRLTNRRGPGNLAQLVPSAIEAHHDARTRLAVAVWIDRLGTRLAQGRAASAAERTLGRQVAAECAALDLEALGLYARSGDRLPLPVRRVSYRAA